MQKIQPQPTISSFHSGEKDQKEKSVIGILDVVPNTRLPFADPENQLIGYSFTAGHAGETGRVQMKGKDNDKHMWSMQMGMRTT